MPLSDLDRAAKLHLLQLTGFIKRRWVSLRSEYVISWKRDGEKGRHAGDDWKEDLFSTYPPLEAGECNLSFSLAKERGGGAILACRT